MIQSTSSIRSDINLLKGVSILAVICYHLGIVSTGYLGVDIFFVINGFFIIPRILTDILEEKFSYFSFLKKRVLRLFPLVVFISTISIVIGYFGMLPDDYENLCQSVIASNFFSNNILCAITTNNYWDVVNDFKPLMHTWYIGILFEFYIIFPILLLIMFFLCKKLNLKPKKYIIIFVVIIFITSIILFLSPCINPGYKFYLLPFRFFEIILGGLMGIFIKEHKKHLYVNNKLSGFLFTAVLLILFSGFLNLDNNKIAEEYNIVNGAIENNKFIVPQSALILCVVTITSLFIILDNKKNSIICHLTNLKLIPYIGEMSYSIFIWHQPILAFSRYFYSSDISLSFIILYVFIIFVLSYFSYRYIEQKNKISLWINTSACVLFIITNACAFFIYLKAGVVRDVPELYVNKNDVHRNMFAEYNDRIYVYDKDFPLDNKKLNVLVIGNSFARDWANIMLESNIKEKINLSYIFHINESYIDRIKNSNYIFYFGWKKDLPDYVWENIGAETPIYGIGTKNFGDSNGIIYKNRNKENYYNQLIKINPNFFKINKLLKQDWGDKYIDLLEIISNNKDSVIVFSPEKKFLSQDTRHLSKGGAEFFAKKIDMNSIFNISPKNSSEKNSLLNPI